MATVAPINDVASLRAIIHSLKMDGHTLSDQGAQTHINALIKVLPTPEQLSSMAGDRAALQKVSEQVGIIMEQIEQFGKRDEASKAQHIAVKGIPPRHKILKRRQAMDVNKRVAIREIVNLSAVMDYRNQPKIASKLIRCASALKDDSLNSDELDSVLKEIEASGNGAVLKEAAMWDNIKGQFSGMGGHVKNEWKALRDPMKAKGAWTEANGLMGNLNKNVAALMQKLTQYWQQVQDQQFKNDIAKVYQALEGFKSNSDQIAKQVAALQPDLRRQRMPIYPEEEQAPGTPGAEQQTAAAPEAALGAEQAAPGPAPATPGAAPQTPDAKQKMAQLVKEHPELLQQYPQLAVEYGTK